VGLAVVLVLAFSGGSAKPPVEDKRPSAPVVVEPTPPTPPPSSAQEPKTAEPQVPMAQLLADAKTAAQAEKWDEALALVTKATVREPGSAEAVDLRKTVESEKTNSEKLAALKQDLANKDYEVVLKGAAEIPDDSMYRAQAIELRKSAQTQFVATHLEVARSKLTAGECDDARREAELVLGLEAKNKKAADVVKRCEALANKPQPEPVAAVVKTAHHRPVAAPVAQVAAAPKAKPPEAPKPETGADPDKLIKDAQQAWFRGQYAAAVDSARKALRAKPSLTNAYQIIAVCSCALHDADAAAKAFEKLDERNKLYVKSACQKNGISF
jgi:tetratricopeptide (TPR) repeat protein